MCLVPGRVDFLDDDHLVISAPVAYTCDKRDRAKPTDTQLTVIDLEGHELASTHRSDIVEQVAGPIGHFAVCTGDRLDLLSSDLKVARSIAISTIDPYHFCFPMLSPSRTAIAVVDTVSMTPRITRYRLFEHSASEPLAEVRPSKGQSVRAVADDGFLVCVEEEKRCDVVGSHGRVRSFAMPELGGASGYYVVGLVAPDRLLVAGFDGEHLYAETPTGEVITMGDVVKLRPPFIGATRADMSAAEPRRVLYSIDGCLLGDFDDCYGVVFHRFAVFDSQTSRMLFRHSYGANADLKISPNGHLVMEQDGPEIRLFEIP